MYSSLSIARVTKSRRTRGAGYVARIDELRNVYILVCKSEMRSHLGRLRCRFRGETTIEMAVTSEKGVRV
jgi:hypothetical protein